MVKHITMLNYLASFFIVLMILSSFVYGNESEPMKLLWEIGKHDNQTREFALGPDRYNDFSEDAFFVVGKSYPKTDWPYVQPGPSDAWAGGKEHVFTILFGLQDDIPEGILQLTVDLINTHHSAPPVLTIDLNGYSFSVQVPHGGSDASLEGHPEAGKEFRFSCTFPSGICKKGINTMIIKNTSGSWIIYDRIGLEAPLTAKLADVPDAVVQSINAPQVLLEKNGSLHRPITLKVLNTVNDHEATVLFNGVEITSQTLCRGNNTIEVYQPAQDTETLLNIEVKAGEKTIARYDKNLKPVRKWSVYFLPHSHVDIGYTQLQSDVERVQWKNIEDGIELAEKTANYPVGAQFKWNTEVLWAVDSYLENASEEKRQQFIEAVRNSRVGLDALYGSFLTGLARPEELYEFTSFARSLRKKYGFNIDSAMITDVPGYTWGMVPTLVESGIKYFNPGPNHMPMLPHQGDRIGYTSEEWGDKPFYWISPSGKEKLLVWIPRHGYSWFHDWILGNIKKAGSEPILGYLDELNDQKYPYEIVQLRYTVGADNGPPDPDLPEFVKTWNATYAYPKMIIATTGEMFREFEKRYGDKLPEYRGDFTPYWEDGAASTAFETALNRTAAERLIQAQTLWAIHDHGHFPAEEFRQAWRNIILFTEHTWGAHNSISAPDDKFVIGQWNIKKAFALNADSMSQKLLTEALPEKAEDNRIIKFVDVYNTTSWSRTDLVILPNTHKTAGDCVKDENGEKVPSQRLSTGNLAFLAGDIPALGARRFSLHKDSNPESNRLSVTESTISNGLITIGINQKTGAILSFKHKEIDGDFVNGSTGSGLNEYFYVPGKDPSYAQRNGETTIRIKEYGPLVVSLMIKSKAPGCNNLIREIRLIDGIDRVDIINTVDKKRVTEKESVHFGFPFNVPDGEVRLDIAWGVIRPDIDQLPGANKNYFTIQRWADISNDTSGITLATPDTPLLEIGDMNAEKWNLDSTRPWLKSVEPSQTLYSYVMNNYWHTNYKAYQEGSTTFRYSLKPHKKFNSAETKRFGIENSQPLITIPVTGDIPVIKSFTPLSSGNIIVSSIKPCDGGKSLLVRLFNTSDKSERLTRPSYKHVWLSNPSGDTIAEFSGHLDLTGYDKVTLIVSGN
ncbi:MAG: glycoside hydrolase [Candidatus Latescibacteria bacterium]|nr:glycoside hydrolase [Candidatus Latescibacterota bacterium]